MDQITISKLLTHLAYPAGLIATFTLLSLFYLLFRKTTSAFISLLLASSIFLLTSSPIISSRLVSSLEQKYPQQSIASIPTADVIVVLGGSLRPPKSPRRTSQMTNSSDRFWHAAKLFKAGKAKKILLTGGNVFPNAKIKPEAFYVKQILIDLGIPETAILLEEHSKTTEENAIFSRLLLNRYGFKHILLVTSAMHMPRAVKLFQSPKLTITPCSTDVYISSSNMPNLFKWIPSAKAFAISTLALHEYYGVWYHQIKNSITSFFNT